MNIPKIRRHILEESRDAFSVPGQVGLPLVQYLPETEREETHFLRELASVNSSRQSVEKGGLVKLGGRRLSCNFFYGGLENGTSHCLHENAHARVCVCLLAVCS